MIPHELHQWPNDEKLNQNLHKVIHQNLIIGHLNISLYLVFASNNDIDLELSPATKSYIEKVHNAYIMHLKVLFKR